MADEAFIHCDYCGQDVRAIDFDDHARAEAEDRIKEVQDQLPS